MPDHPVHLNVRQTGRIRAQGQSEITVMWDTLQTIAANFNHVPGGSNVLFLDGHVDFIRYPGPAPVNPLTANIFGGISRLLGGA